MKFCTKLSLVVFQAYVAVVLAKKGTKPPFRGRTALQPSLLMFLSPKNMFIAYMLSRL